MKKYLNKFNNLTEYQSFKNNSDWVIPNVSYINNLNSLEYNGKSSECFTIESLENNNEVTFTQNIQYSSNGSSWSTLNYGDKLVLNGGDTVRFKGNLTVGTYGIGTFSATKRYNVKGNIMSLLYGDSFIGKNDLTGKDSAFRQLFYNSTTLVDASDLILPATTLSNGCYSYMFQGCTSLVTAPELPATTLASGCYNYMFQNCTSLVTAPELPATTLAYGCYGYMFYNCINLNKITMLATDISASNCLYNWVNGVSSTGTFYKHKDMTSLQIGNSGTPSGWSVVNFNS